MVSARGAASSAEIVTWEFSGKLDSVVGGLQGTFTTFEVGSLLEGTFSFDSLTPDTYDHPGTGYYVDAITAISGSVDGIGFSGPYYDLRDGIANALQVSNHLSDYDDFYTLYAGLILSGRPFELQLWLRFPPMEILTEALPTQPPQLDAATATRFSLRADGIGDSLRIAGPLSTLQLVPEPTYLGLLFFLATVMSRRVARSRLD